MWIEFISTLGMWPKWVTGLKVSGGKSKSSSKPTFNKGFASDQALASMNFMAQLFGGPSFIGTPQAFKGGLFGTDPSAFSNQGNFMQNKGLFSGIPGLFGLPAGEARELQSIISRGDAGLESFANKMMAPTDPERVKKVQARAGEPLIQDTEAGKQAIIDTEIQRGGGNVRIGAFDRQLRDLVSQGRKGLADIALDVEEFFANQDLQRAMAGANVLSDLTSRKESAKMQKEQAGLQRRFQELMMRTQLFGQALSQAHGQKSSSSGSQFGLSF